MPEHANSYLDTLPGLQEAGAAVDPAWVADLRRRALASLHESGLPTARDEDWKHNPIGKVLSRNLDISLPAVPATVGLEVPKIDGMARLVFVDGHYMTTLSDTADLPAGVRVESLRRALRESADGVPEWLGRCAEFATRGLLALNTAVPADGALVVLERGTRIPETIHLVYVTTGASAGRLRPVRNLFVAEPGSEGRVLEHHVGPGADAVTSLVTEIAVADGASLEVTKLVEGNRATTHLASIDALVEGNGRLGVRTVSAGGANCRTETHVGLTGRGGECDLVMAVLGRESEIQDQLTRVVHAAPDTLSRQLHRAVIDGKSRSIFNGLVVVEPGAHGTSGEQSSRSLLLSPDADAHARPQLDISEDDVRCAHGATVGALDPDALFYLRSRGIDTTDAQRLLVRAFVMEVVARIPDGAARTEAERVLSEWLAS